MDVRFAFTTLPVRDMERAKSFYADRLNLEPYEEAPEGVHYRSGSGEFLLFESSGSATGAHTQMGFIVDDIEAAVGELRANGVVFEDYHLPGLKTVNGIAEIPGEKAAWFRDSEGNLLSLGELIR